MNRQHYYTFGPDQRLPNGETGNGTYVVVDCPDWCDPRTIIWAWLDSGPQERGDGPAFASEYSESQWTQVGLRYSGIQPAALIRVTVTQ